LTIVFSILPTAAYMIYSLVASQLENLILRSYSLIGYYLFNILLAILIVLYCFFYIRYAYTGPKNKNTIWGLFIGSLLILIVYILALNTVWGEFSIYFSNYFLLFCIMCLVSAMAGFILLFNNQRARKGKQ